MGGLQIVMGDREGATFTAAHHGHTGLALAAGDPRDHGLWGHDLPGFTRVPFNDLDAMDAATDDDIDAIVAIVRRTFTA